MADKRFLNSCIIPSETVILGKRLKPFCIQHRLWLEAIGSPFMESNKPISAGDLITALKICAHEEIGRKLWHDRWISFRLGLSKELFLLACKAFVQYCDTTALWPKFYDRKSEGGGSTVPWQLSIIANLTKNGIGYEEAMMMPEPQAIWMASIYSIYAGAKIEILTTDDEEMLDELAKLKTEETEQQLKQSEKTNIKNGK